MENKIKTLHIVIIGDESVGKSCIADRYCNSKFSFTKKTKTKNEEFKREIKVNEKSYLVKILCINNNKPNKIYFKNADCIIAVCSVDDRDSFNNIETWIQNISDEIDISTKLLIIMGNKIDLEENRIILSQHLKSKADYLLAECYEVSAMESTGIDEAFEKIIDNIINKKSKEDVNVNTNNDNKDASKCLIY